ncbi:MAG: sigma-E factor negative regulatory protein [Bdellovibrio sp.]|nr:sigma-E factor negative regulatory protein [Methylotenera sp.]
MKNQLSAFMDGELSIEESAHLITSAKTGGELKNCWAQYHIIGDALRGDVGLGGVNMHYDFTSRVMTALELEPTVLASKLAATPKFASQKTAYKTSTKLWSVAASVAAVMFVGVMVFQQQFSQPETLSPVEIAQSVPTEYLQAHQAAAPSSAAYYIQNASFAETKK